MTTTTVAQQPAVFCSRTVARGCHGVANYCVCAVNHGSNSPTVVAMPMALHIWLLHDATVEASRNYFGADTLSKTWARQSVSRHTRTAALSEASRTPSPYLKVERVGLSTNMRQRCQAASCCIFVQCRALRLGSASRESVLGLR